jgi:hypothetical protein
LNRSIYARNYQAWLPGWKKINRSSNCKGDGQFAAIRSLRRMLIMRHIGHCQFPGWWCRPMNSNARSVQR